ncbi:MAG: ATP-binding protein, partial [Candidatus Electrothrix sp. ATG2]|nr:ATP-binding protein [Candidatus Electrothrix sp. ATG2]
MNEDEMMQIHVSDDVDKILSIVKAKELAKRAGFNEHEGFMIATAVSELATNILRYAQEGQITIRIVHR